jgi:hypothetical protein
VGPWAPKRLHQITQTVEEKNRAIVCENHNRPGAMTDMTELLDAVIAAHGGMERWSARPLARRHVPASPVGCWILRVIRGTAGLRLRWTLRHHGRSFRG